MAAPSLTPCRWTGAAGTSRMERLRQAPERRDFRADPERADLALRTVFWADADPRRYRPRLAALASRRADAMTALRVFPAILLFGPGTAILPSRPVSAPPARAAKVKGGAAGAPWRASPLTEASTLAALPRVGGVAALVRKRGAVVARRAAAKRARPSADRHSGRRGDRYADDAADIRCAARRAPIPGRNTALSRRARAADGRHVGCVARGRESDGIADAVCFETADPGPARPHRGRSLRGRCRASRCSFRARGSRGS